MKFAFPASAVIFAVASLVSLAACSESKQPAADTAPKAPPIVTKMAAPAMGYPLTTCPVSGEKLGEMGAPVVKTYKGVEVRFCCDKCPPKFEKDLDANLAKFADAKAKAMAGAK